MSREFFGITKISDDKPERSEVHLAVRQQLNRIGVTVQYSSASISIDEAKAFRRFLSKSIREAERYLRDGEQDITQAQAASAYATISKIRDERKANP